MLLITDGIPRTNHHFPALYAVQHRLDGSLNDGVTLAGGFRINRQGRDEQSRQHTGQGPASFFIHPGQRTQIKPQFHIQRAHIMQAVRLFAQGFPPIFRVTHDDRIPGDHLPDIRQYAFRQTGLHPRQNVFQHRQPDIRIEELAEIRFRDA